MKKIIIQEWAHYAMLHAEKMNPFVWFASLTNGLFFKDGSNILHVQCNLDMYSVVFFCLVVASFQLLYLQNG